MRFSRPDQPRTVPRGPGLGPRPLDHAGGRVHTDEGESEVSRLGSALHSAGGCSGSATKIKNANRQRGPRQPLHQCVCGRAS
jgi:hypothetical protein